MMPIRPENRARYPADWPDISRNVRESAGQMCEQCGVPNAAMIRRGISRDGRAVWRLCSASAYEDGRCAMSGDYVPDTGEDTVGWGEPVRVVLTVAHPDHTPENCAPENLRALCQRCHNSYDAPMRAAGIRRRRHDARAVGDLFDGETT